MRADDDFTHLTAISAFGHGVFEITRSGPPNVTRAFTNLLESLSTRRLRPELIKDRLVVPHSHLRQRCIFSTRPSPRKLSRYEVLFAVLQVLRQFRRLQCRKHLRCTRDLRSEEHTSEL